MSLVGDGEWACQQILLLIRIGIGHCMKTINRLIKAWETHSWKRAKKCTINYKLSINLLRFKEIFRYLVTERNWIIVCIGGKIKI